MQAQSRERFGKSVCISTASTAAAGAALGATPGELPRPPEALWAAEVQMEEQKLLRMLVAIPGLEDEAEKLRDMM